MVWFCKVSYWCAIMHLKSRIWRNLSKRSVIFFFFNPQLQFPVTIHVTYWRHKGSFIPEMYRIKPRNTHPRSANDMSGVVFSSTASAQLTKHLKRTVKIDSVSFSNGERLMTEGFSDRRRFVRRIICSYDTTNPLPHYDYEENNRAASVASTDE